MSTSLPADALRSVDEDAMRDAIEAYDEVARIHRRVSERATDADAAVKQARLDIENLVARVADGDDEVTDADVIRAYVTEREALALSTFYGMAKVRTAAREAEAVGAYRLAELHAKAPMVTWAINHRIAAARKLDEAKAALEVANRRCSDTARAARGEFLHWQQAERRQAAVDAADAERAMLEARDEVKRAERAGAEMFAEANAVLHDRTIAEERAGASIYPPELRKGGRPAWPSTEVAERAHFGVPAHEPEPARLENAA